MVNLEYVRRIADGLFYKKMALLPEQFHFLLDSAEYIRIGVKTINAIYERASGISFEAIEDLTEVIIRTKIRSNGNFIGCVDEAIFSDSQFSLLPEELQFTSDSIPEAIALRSITHVLGKIHRNLNQDVKAALCFAMATEMGCERSMEFRNQLFLEGRGIGQVNVCCKHLSTIDSAQEFLEQELTNGSPVNKAKVEYHLGVIEELRGSFVIARRYYEQAAQANVHSASYKLAKCYLQGNADLNIDVSLYKAFKFFLNAATANPPSSKALYWLGKLYFSGNKELEIAKNESVAIEYFKLSADWGNVKAAYMVGLLLLDPAYSESPTAHQDPELCSDAIKYLTYAADRGLRDAIYALGRIYEDGIVVDPDLSQALELLSLVASGEEYPYAAFRYGQFCLSEYGELGLAAQYFRYAAGPEYPEAAYWVAMWLHPLLSHLSTGNEIVLHNKRKPKQASFYKDCELFYTNLKIAADGGIPEACYELGKFYSQDYAFDYPEKRILGADRQIMINKWYEKAAEMGHINAAKELGDKYFTSSQKILLNSPKKLYEENRAIKFYKMIINKHRELALYIGDIYLKRMGSYFIDEKTKLKAIRYYKIAADDGNNDEASRTQARNILKKLDPALLFTTDQLNSEIKSNSQPGVVKKSGMLKVSCKVAPIPESGKNSVMTNLESSIEKHFDEL
jgi:TPR repeat protein